MNRKNILLVDDVDLFLDLEAGILAREEFVLHRARSGREAIDQARALRPDLILLDLYMPDVDGDEVCRVLKAQTGFANTPVVMVSSDTGKATRDRCFEAGCDGFVQKPLQGDILLATIEEMLKVAQRKTPRVFVRIECGVHSAAGEVRALIHCLSEGGAFVGVENGFDRGSTLKLSFTLQANAPPVKVDAVVRWVGPLSRERTIKGAGVEFRALDPAVRDAIRAFIEGRRRLTLPNRVS